MHRRALLAAAVLDADAQPLSKAIRPDRFGLLFGNEAQGLAAEYLAICDRRITIPMEFTFQWDDAVAPREGGLALFDAFGSREKTMHINPGAHGAIPANSNVVPRACVMAYESAMAGDWAGARSAQALATRYDDLAEVARGGSPNAATLSSLKHVLRAWGIIDDPTVARPSRSLTADEVAELNRRLPALPRAPSRD